MAEVSTRIRITADADGAVRELESVETAAEQVDDAIRQVDGETVTVDADDTEVRTLRGALNDITDSEHTVRISAPGADRAADQIGRARDNTSGLNETAQRGIGPLRGLTDELGGAAGAGGTAAAALIDGGEALEIFGAKAGLSQRALGRISGALGGIGLAVGLATAAWAQYRKSQQEAEEAAQKLLEVQESLVDQKYRKAAEDLFELWPRMFEDAAEAGVDVEDVIQALNSDGAILGKTMDDWDIPINEALTPLQALVLEVNNQRDAWSEARDEAVRTDETVEEIEDSLRDVEGAVTDVDLAMEGLANTTSIRNSWLDVEQQFDDVKSAGIEAASGGERATRQYERAVNRLIGEVLDYDKAVGGLPDEVLTEVITYIQRGQYELAEQALSELEADRSVTYIPKIEIPPSELEELKRINNLFTQSAARSTTNVTVNTGSAVDGRTVQTATDAWTRNNGTRWTAL